MDLPNGEFVEIIHLGGVKFNLYMKISYFLQKVE